MGGIGVLVRNGVMDIGEVAEGLRVFWTDIIEGVFVNKFAGLAVTLNLIVGVAEYTMGVRGVAVALHVTVGVGRIAVALIVTVGVAVEQRAAKLKFGGGFFPSPHIHPSTLCGDTL